MRHYTNEKLQHLATQVTAQGLWEYLVANNKLEDSEYVRTKILHNE
jgi:hypothetical protein